MDEFIKQCMEEGPYPYPLENIKDDIEVCFSHRMMVLDNRAKTDFPAGVHQHSSYEFIVLFQPGWATCTCLLKKTQLEKEFLNEISRMLSSNFTKTFKKIVGVSPSVYRKLLV